MKGGGGAEGFRVYNEYMFFFLMRVRLVGTCIKKKTHRGPKTVGKVMKTILCGDPARAPPTRGAC